MSKALLWTTFAIKLTKMVCLKKTTIDSVYELRSDPTGGKPTAGAKYKLAFRRCVGSGRNKKHGRKKLLTLFFLNWTCSIILVSWTLTNGEPFSDSYRHWNLVDSSAPIKRNVLICWVLQTVAWLIILTFPEIIYSSFLN